jgi:UDP-N-acetylmuramoylalanine--D-glutamate ligase
LIFASQAWYKYKFNFPKLKDAKEKGTPFKTIINLYLDLFPGVTIGITGSNGKTTTTSLAHHVLKSLHDGQVFSSGNIDSTSQDLDKILSASESDILILEISNRQLKLLEDSHAAFSIVTNITENHLDEHDSFQEYAETKLRLCQGSIPILNDKDEATKLYSKIENPIWFNNEDILKEFKLKASDYPLAGQHNLENLYAVLHLLKTLKTNGKINYENSQIKSALQSFKTPPRRLEPIGELNGVNVINDLSSTTPTSTVKAVEAFSDSAFSLVLGCDHKGGNYDELIEKLSSLQKSGVLKKIFVLPGSIRELLHNSGLEITNAQNFEDIAIQTSPDFGKHLLVSPSGEHVISVHLKNKNLKKIFSICPPQQANT